MKPVNNEVWDQVRRQVVGRFSDQLWDQAADQAWFQVKNQVMDQVEYEVRLQVSYVRDQVSEQILVQFHEECQ